MTLSRAEALKMLTASGQPYELAHTSIRGRDCRVFAHAPLSLRELFADNVSDATFIVYQSERYSFADIYRQAARLAHCLINDYGVEKGDRVAIYLPQIPEAVVAMAPLAPPEVQWTDDDTLRVPSLTGLSYRDAMSTLQQTGLAIKIEGSGRVVAQAPPSGTALPAGSTVTITLD